LQIDELSVSVIFVLNRIYFILFFSNIDYSKQQTSGISDHSISLLHSSKWKSIVFPEALQKIKVMQRQFTLSFLMTILNATLIILWPAMP